MDTYIVLKRFSSLEEAQECHKLLSEKGVTTRLADNVPPVDITFSGNTVGYQYEIQIDPANFANAESILEEQEMQSLPLVEDDHYLYQFSDQELLEILQKPDEWNKLDYALAREILLKRGKEIDQETLDLLKQERLMQLREPEPQQKYWVIFGYISALLGGLLGIAIGYMLFSSRKSLPNGERIFSYSDHDRKHGTNIFYIGLFVFTISVLIKMLWG